MSAAEGLSGGWAEKTDQSDVFADPSDQAAVAREQAKAAGGDADAVMDADRAARAKARLEQIDRATESGI